MNNADQEYFNLLNLVLAKGRVKKNRTGQDTLGVFGAQARFNLSQNFPLLTTKKVSFKNIVHELLWFISGSTNIKYLVDNNVNIWNADCYKKYCEFGKNISGMAALRDKYHSHYETYVVEDPNSNIVGCLAANPFTIEKFAEKIKTDKDFAAKWGDLGDGAYGQMWRAFPYSNKEEIKQQLSSPFCGDFIVPPIPFEKTVDQISKLIDGLKNNPDSRRHIVTAWHPHLVETVVLPPCHTLWQMHTEELTESERIEEGVNNSQKYCLPHVDDPYECFATYDHDQLDGCGIPRRRLNCHFFMRSTDILLGLPYDVASYALLTHMIAQVVGMVPGELLYSVTDLHLYESHIQQAKEQLSRTPFPAPRLKLNHNITNIFDFKYEDIVLENYQSHSSIRAPIVV